MNDTAPRPVPAAPATEVTAKPRKSTALSRITLALLDQYAIRNEAKGTDPYDTTRGSPTDQHWRGNARRL